MVLFIMKECRADITLLRKYSHKTVYSLEQLIAKADHILIVKKQNPLITEKVIEFKKEEKCPPYSAKMYNFKVLEIIGGKPGILNGQIIRVKEPFSDMAYTFHYSYYTKGFIIEPFLGEYYPKISFEKTDSLIVFINAIKTADNKDALFQFSVFDAFDSKDKKKEVLEIIKRPPADMKKLFLKQK